MSWWLPIAIAFCIMAFYATVAHREQRNRKRREAAWRKKYEHGRSNPTRLTPPSQRDKPSDDKPSQDDETP